MSADQTNTTGQGLHLSEVVFQVTDLQGNPRQLLAPLNETFEPGVINLITGPTGSGKSTLLALLACILRPTQGTVYAHGEPVSRWSTGHRDRWRQRVGIVLQAPTLLEGLTVMDNVLLPLVPRSFTRTEKQSTAQDALNRVSLDHLKLEKVDHLSGGERQRTAWARALVHKPEFLFLDELTTHQDPDGVKLLCDILSAAKSRGTVVVAATHDPRLIEIGDRVWGLDNGELVPVSR